MDLTGKNRGSYLLFIPTNSVQRYDQATYNNKKYNVKEIRIYKKSIHNYGGRKIESELLIIHESVMGTKLTVCIPIKIANGNSITMMDRLVSHISKLAPSKGGNAGKLELDTFTLNDFIPKKKYLVHSGSSNFPVKGEYIVFKEDSPIYISNVGYNKLSELIEEHSYNKIEKLKLEGFNLLGGFKEGMDHDGNIDLVESEALPTITGEDSNGNGPDDSYECYVDEDDGESEKILLSTSPNNSQELFNDSKSSFDWKGWLYLVEILLFGLTILFIMSGFAFVYKKIFGGGGRGDGSMTDIPPVTPQQKISLV
jgi:hypothetical protein